MGSRYGNAPEKLVAGVGQMVTHPAGLKKRLLDAYVDQIQYVKPENVPEGYRPRLRQIHEIMTGANLSEGPKDPRIGTIEHAVDLLTVDDAMDIARAIFDLYDSVLHATYDERDASEHNLAVLKKARKAGKT